MQKLQVVDILYDLSSDNFISEIDQGRYRYNDWGTTVVGTFMRRQNGKNSFIPEDGGTPIFVAERNSAHALNGDKVKIQLHAKRKGLIRKARSLRFWKAYNARSPVNYR